MMILWFWVESECVARLPLESFRYL